MIVFRSLTKPEVSQIADLELLGRNSTGQTCIRSSFAMICHDFVVDRHVLAMCSDFAVNIHGLLWIHSHCWHIFLQTFCNIQLTVWQMAQEWSCQGLRRPSVEQRREANFPVLHLLVECGTACLPNRKHGLWAYTDDYAWVGGLPVQKQCN